MKKLLHSTITNLITRVFYTNRWLLSIDSNIFYNQNDQYIFAVLLNKTALTDAERTMPWAYVSNLISRFFFICFISFEVQWLVSYTQTHYARYERIRKRAKSVKLRWLGHQISNYLVKIVMIFGHFFQCIVYRRVEYCHTQLRNINCFISLKVRTLGKF